VAAGTTKPVRAFGGVRAVRPRGMRRLTGFRVWAVALPGLLAGCGGEEPGGPALLPVSAAELRRAVREPGAKVVLVNMWATWCAPCREEFPDLLRLQRAYRQRGLRVLLVCWDADARQARKFLARQGVDFPSFMKSDAESDAGFIDAFEPRWTGAFPATFIYDESGTLRHFWEGKASYATFEEKIRNVLDAASRAN
jgi:thiol-disulfide isomerase/thioredoxin